MTIIPYILMTKDGTGNYHVAALVYDEQWLQPVIKLFSFKSRIKIERAGTIIDPFIDRRYPPDEEAKE